MKKLFFTQYQIKIVEQNGSPEEEIKNIIFLGGVEQF